MTTTRFKYRLLQRLAALIISILALTVVPACSSQQEVAQKVETENAETSDRDERLFKQSFFNGEKEKISGNLDAAMNHFRRCTELLPNESAPYYEMARLYAEQNKLEMALPNLEKAMERDPENVWYQSMYAQVNAGLGNYDKAIKTYESLIEINPRQYEYHFELAGTHIMKEDYDAAIGVFDDLEKAVGMNEELSMQKQMLYMEMGKIEKAIEEVLKLVEANPEEIRYWGILAELYHKNGQRDKAMEAYEALTALDPDNGMLHLSISEFYRNSGDDQRAFESLKLAFRSSDINIDQKIDVLLAYFTETETNREFIDQAYALCGILVEEHPDDAKAHSIYGDFLYRDERLEEARHQFQQAAEIDQSRYVIWNQLLILDSQLQEFDRMRTTSEKALELFPTMPSFYLFNGVAHLQREEYEAAIESLEAGIDLVVENFGQLAQFYASLGDAYHAIDKHKASDEAYESSLSVQEDNAYVLNNYSYYLSVREENLERALEMSKRANELQPGEATFQDTHAWVLYKLERFAEAREWLEKALNSGGVTDGTILEHYGDVLFQLGRKEEALEYWQQAAEAGGASDNIEKKIADRQLHE